jgi:cytidine deaminase
MHYNFLFQLAKRAREYSHSPYSKFAVGCAIEDEKGSVYFGTNLENINWSETICAERSAIAHMIANGGKKVRKVVVVTPANKTAYPCGSCRQVIQEFASIDCEIITVGEDGQNYHRIPFKELFPHAFKPGSI